MHIAVIGGTGKEGFGLAVRWARSGHAVVIGSRSKDRADEAAVRAAALAPDGRVQGAGNREAASRAEVIILAIPFAGHDAIMMEIRAETVGKTVIDTTVPLRQYAPPELERVAVGSAAEQVQRLLPEARVIAALHSVSSVKLSRFEEPLDAGPLRAASTLESLAALIIAMNQRYKRKAIGIRFIGV